METLDGIGAILGEKELKKYSDYLHGARMMFAYLCDKGFVNACNDITKAQGHDVYEKAVERLILDSMGATHKFMLGAEIKFSEHKRNENGKLVQRVDNKPTSINAARRLFPDVDFRRTAKCKAIDDNKCDAMLICDYGRRKNL